MRRHSRIVLYIFSALLVCGILPQSSAGAATADSITTTSTALIASQTAPSQTLTPNPVASASATLPWKTYQETDRNISYTGTWSNASSSRSSGGAVKLTSAKGTTATLTFTGTGVKWLGITATTYGQAAVTIDGGTAANVSMTTSSPQYQQTLFHKEGLSNTAHKLKITVTSSAPKFVGIDAFQVQGYAGPPDPAPRPATNAGNGWIGYEETNSHITFIGSWGVATNAANSGGALKYSKQPGAAAMIRFTGDAVEWDGIRAATCGKAHITLDGVGRGTIDLTTGNTYYKQALYRKTGLDASKVHTLTITVASATPTLACVDRIMVHNGSAVTFAPATESGNGWNGYYELHSSIVYSGTWTKVSSSRSYDGAIKSSSTKGASFQVSFKGDSIEWIGITASTYGTASIAIDGITQKSINLATSSPQYKQALFHREGLSIGKTHVLKVTVTSAAPKLVTIDRIVIHGTAIVPPKPAAASYVDVDISEQTLRYYVNGKVVLSSPVVTGRPSMPTVQGTFAIYLKSRNTYLNGPGYHTLVSYWMPFYKGYGLHDAVWQAKFGGQRYKQGYGSHGCVNMPLDKARALYGMVSVGTKVIVHQ